MKYKSLKISMAAAILAGGKAKRLNGIIKANIPIKKEVTILQHLCAEIKKADIHDIIIVANDNMPYVKYNLPIVPDNYVNIGAIGGIESALNYYANKFHAILFLPSDLPFITMKEILKLISEFINNPSSIVYAKTLDQEHPLCVIVPSLLISQIRLSIENKIYQIRKIWKESQNPQAKPKN